MISRPIDSPSRGDKMRASWGAAVSELVNECAGEIDALRGPGELSSSREPTTVRVPFSVRYHEDQWEIFMPLGCMNVGGTCAPINPAASASGVGHATDSDGWRLLGLDETSGTTGTDGDGNTYREWSVTVHAKTSSKMYGVDGLSAPARRLVWAGVTDMLKSTFTDAERYKDTPGDTFSAIVASVRVTTVTENGASSTVRKVTQLRKTPIDVGDVPAPTGYDLVWYFSVEDGALTVEKVYCVRQISALAGMSVTGDQMTDVTDAENVYCRIDSANIADDRNLATVVADPQAPHTSTNYLTWLPLYHLTENMVTADYRENSFRNVQIYRA